MTKIMAVLSAGLILLFVSPAFAGEIEDKLKSVTEQLAIAQSSVEYLLTQRNSLESALIIANTNVKRLSTDLDAVKKEMESKISEKDKDNGKKLTK